MAVRKEGDKYIIENPSYGNVSAGSISTTMPEGQVFTAGGGSIVGTIKDGKIYTTEVKNAGINIQGLPTWEDWTAFTTERGGMLERIYGDQTSDFWNSLNTSAMTADTTRVGMEGSNVGGLSQEQINEEALKAQMSNPQTAALLASGQPLQPAQTTGTGTVNMALASGQTTGQSSSQTNTNPFFGIPASISGQLTSTEQAQAFQNYKAQGLSDQESLSKVLATSGGATSTTAPATQQMGEYVSNPDYLKYYTEDEIIRGADGKIYLKPGIPTRWTTNSAVKQAIDEKEADFSLSIPDIIDSTTFTESQNTGTVFGDLQNLFNEMKSLRTDLINSLKPSEEEKTLQQQLIDLRNNANLSLLGIENQAIPMPFIVGQQREQLKLYQAQEQNLIDRLGLTQEARETAANVASTGLEFLMSDIDLRFKVADKIQKQNEIAFNQAMQLSTQAKNNLALILDNFAGVRVNDLSAQDQAKLAQLAAQAGIPFDLISKGMDATAAQLEFKNILDAAKLNGDTLAGLTEQQISILQNLQGQIRQDADVKNFVEVRQAYNRVLSATKEPSAAGDLALIFNYMKMLDPGSTVREGEFANAQNSAGVPERLRANYNQIVNGERLSVNQRNDFVNQAKGLYESQLGSYENAINFYKNQAETFNIPTELLTRDYSGTIGDITINLPALNQSYNSLQSLLNDNPLYKTVVADILFNEPNLDDNDILQLLTFNSDLGMSKNYLSNYGQITGFGSPLWGYGLDIDLQKGDPVYSPITGTVVKSEYNGGFGNQVQIKDSSGNLIMLSHLDSTSVKPGTIVKAGQLVGKGGNTGNTIPGQNSDGSHLDITIKKPDGSYYSATEVYKLLA